MRSPVTALTLRIVLVHGIVERHDAISSSVRDMADILAGLGYRVTVLTKSSHYGDKNIISVHGVEDLLLNEEFLLADVIIWHFGIYYDLFDVCQVGNGKAVQVVCFHNITPKELVPTAAVPVVEKSLDRAHLLSRVDEVWAVSELNARTALDYGVSADAIVTIPLQVDTPNRSSLMVKSRDRIELLYVGRFTKAKGVDDLLEAVDRMSDNVAVPFRLRLVGNLTFSDQAYVEELKKFIEVRKLESVIDLIGTVQDNELFDFYRQAHILAIASYHEGVCKPVIEGLRAGCVPIVYDAYNLPFVLSGLGKLVRCGDVGGLSDGLAALVVELSEALQNPKEPCLLLERGSMSALTFDSYVTQYVGGFTRDAISDMIDCQIRKLIERN